MAPSPPASEEHSRILGHEQLDHVLLAGCTLHDESASILTQPTGNIDGTTEVLEVAGQQCGVSCVCACRINSGSPPSLRVLAWASNHAALYPARVVSILPPTEPHSCVHFCAVPSWGSVNFPAYDVVNHDAPRIFDLFAHFHKRSS